MSATRPTSIETAIERCRPTDKTPVTLEASALPSARHELRELQRELDANDFVPAGVMVDACFDADCSFATQDEADRIREYVRTAAFLGAGTVTVEFDTVKDESKVRPSLAALRERAHREGITLELDGPITLES
jgi:sugar phosphate isomerase/epimerase